MQFETYLEIAWAPVRLHLIRMRMSRIALQLGDRVAALRSDEKAATLAIANAMLISLSKTIHPALSRKPQLLPKNEVLAIVSSLIASRDLLQKSLKGALDRPEGDLASNQTKRQLVATELVCLTSGISLQPALGPLVTSFWRDLYKCHLEKMAAARLLLAFEQTYKVSPFPAGVEASAASYVRLSSVLPPLFRKSAND